MSAASRRAKALCASILRRGDLEITRYSYSLRAVRARLLAEAGIDLALDVGANTGQYALELRASGYHGRIVSFEPLEDAFAELSRRTVRDPLWEARQLAVGETDGTVTVNIAGNSVSSSILRMLTQHEQAAPSSAYTGTCVVPIARLDSICSDLLAERDQIHLKLDVQGFEMQALRGATSILPQVVSLEAELSLAPLYEDQVLMSGMIDFLRTVGFQLVWIERGFLDPRTSHMLQVDGLFLRRGEL